MDITMQRIISELQLQGKKQTELADYIGVTSNVITDWKSGRIKSYSKYIFAIAAFLNVSVEYLKGETDQKETTAETDSLSPIKQKILNNCSNLSEKELDDVLDYIEYKISQRKR